MKNSEHITLENLHQFSIPLEEHPLKWKFENEKQIISSEYKDQIIALNTNAVEFLTGLEPTFLNFQQIENQYKEIFKFKSGEGQTKNLKKWLYQLPIPFKQEVIWLSDIDSGFILTWKMIIKFCDTIFFGNDELIWDKTLNWCLCFDHNDIFYFGKNRISKG